MRTLQIFGNPMEAEIVRARLDAAGILAVVNGGEVGTMLSHIGSAAVSIRVEVAPEDFEQAEAILREDELERSQRQPWVCSRCDERNEPLFDMCWSCSKQRSESDPQAVPEETRSISIEEPEPMLGQAPVSRRPSSDNPYAPTLTLATGGGRGLDALPAEPDEQLVETVARVFRGAVIGTVLLPPLVTFYVICVLIFIVPQSAYRYPNLRRRLLISWALCLPSIVFAALLWTQFF